MVRRRPLIVKTSGRDRTIGNNHDATGRTNEVIVNVIAM